MVFAMPRGRRPSMSSARAWARRAARGGRRRGRSVRPRQRAQRGRSPAARDREGARTRVEGARPRRADGVADRRRERAAVRADPRDHRGRNGRRLHLPPAARGARASPTGSPCSATARRAARSRPRRVSEDEILRLIIGRSVEQAFPDKPPVDRDAGPLLRVRGLTGPGFHDVVVRRPAGRDRRARRRRGQRAARVPARARGAGRPRGRRCSLDGGPVGGRAQARPCAPASSTCPATATRGRAAAAQRARERLAARAGRHGPRGRRPARPRGPSGVAIRSSSSRCNARPPRRPASSLSGGNQQKVLFARSLLAAPDGAARRRADARRRRRRAARALPGAARRGRRRDRR